LQPSPTLANQDVPVAKTLDDLKRLKEEIMPKVDAT
jgi:hypothetical protein